jgi:hypothetical protein
MGESGSKRSCALSGLVPRAWAISCQVRPACAGVEHELGQEAFGLLDQAGDQGHRGEGRRRARRRGVRRLQA